MRVDWCDVVVSYQEYSLARLTMGGCAFAGACRGLGLHSRSCPHIDSKALLIAKGGKVPRPPPATLARQQTTAPHETPLQDQPQTRQRTNATAHT